MIVTCQCLGETDSIKRGYLPRQIRGCLHTNFQNFASQRNPTLLSISKVANSTDVNEP